MKSVIESEGITYVKGNGYYKLSKKENVSDSKKLIVLNQDEKIFVDQEARTELKLKIAKKISISPKDYPDYKIYIQSTSHSRKFKVSDEVAYVTDETNLNSNLTKMKDDDFELGESKIGGNSVDLPKDIKWPETYEYDDGKITIQKMFFFCQLNLKELKIFDKNNKLPNDGMLYIFIPSTFSSDYGYFTDYVNSVLYFSNKEIRNLGGLKRQTASFKHILSSRAYEMSNEYFADPKKLEFKFKTETMEKIESGSHFRLFYTSEDDHLEEMQEIYEKDLDSRIPKLINFENGQFYHLNVENLKSAEETIRKRLNIKSTINYNNIYYNLVVKSIAKSHQSILTFDKSKNVVRFNFKLTLRLKTMNNQENY